MLLRVIESEADAAGRVDWSGGGCPSTADEEGKGEYPLLSLSEYSAPGACGKARVVLQHRGVDARTGGNGRREMRVVWSLVPIGVWR
jgi:hypothetical protein